MDEPHRVGETLVVRVLPHGIFVLRSVSGEALTRTHWYPNTTRHRSRIADSYCVWISSRVHVASASSMDAAAPFATSAAHSSRW